MKQVINDILAAIVVAIAMAFFFFPQWGLIPYLRWCEALGVALGVHS